MAVDRDEGTILLTAEAGLEGMYVFLSGGRMSAGRKIRPGGTPYVLRRRITCPAGRVRAPEPAPVHGGLTEPLIDLSVDGASSSLRAGDVFTATLEHTGIDPEQGPPELLVSPNLRARVDPKDPNRWTITVLEGGAGWAIACRTEDGGRACSNRILVRGTGPGWYPGDLHAHSDYSYAWQGHSPSEMADAARRKGLGILAITDYNSTAPKPGCAEDRNFLCLAGAEVVSPLYGHGGAYFAGKEPWLRLGPQEWIKRITARGGVFFINHPFLRGRSWKDWSVTGYTGIEVWNDHCGDARSSENLRAFEKWDHLLAGGAHVYGIANSDAHRPVRVGGTRSVFFLSGLTPAALKESLREGHFYGSNGPEIRFTVNGALMGSRVPIKTGDPVTISVQAEDIYPLLKVTLIEDGVAIRRWPGGGERTEVLHPRQSTWYRIEVEGEGVRFAFSNPIWVDVML